jgi:hypothetical protein
MSIICYGGFKRVVHSWVYETHTAMEKIYEISGQQIHENSCNICKRYIVKLSPGIYCMLLMKLLSVPCKAFIMSNACSMKILLTGEKERKKKKKERKKESSLHL